MTCIVSYDIESDAIRAKLSRFLEGKGVRLQKSVFGVEIERHAFSGFLRQLERIKGKEGKIAIFRLCAGCRQNAIQSTEVEKKVHVF